MVKWRTFVFGEAGIAIFGITKYELLAIVSLKSSTHGLIVENLITVTLCIRL